MSAIVEALSRVTNSGKELYSIIGKVIKIDDKKRTCVIEPRNGSANIYGVRLQSGLSGVNGLCIFPVLDSYVVVTFLNKSAAYVALCGEIEKLILVIDKMTFEFSKDGFVFNGGDLGGLIKVDELTTQINKNTAAINALQKTINAWIPVPSDGGAILKTALMAAFVNLQLANLNNIEDEKIKH